MPQEPNEPKPQSQTSETPEGFQAPVSQTGEGQTQFSQQHPTGFQDASGYQVSNYQSYQAVSGAPYAPTDSVDYQPTSNYQASSGAPYTPSGYDTNGWAAPFGYSAQAPYQAQTGFVSPKPKSYGWIVGIVVVVALCLVTMFGMWSCSNAFSSAGTNVGTDADLLTSDTIAIINIDGTIQYDGTTSSPEGLKAQLDIAADNSHIKAVVLRVNSGGGTATAGEEMTEYVREFKEATGKPVVVSSAATNASAAYEISSQADYIYVAKTTAIGAIGTAMQFMDYSGLMEMLGITTEDITSSDSKDSTYGTRALTDEERAYYQAQIDQINETFIENVAEGRAMTTDEVRALATGLTFTGLDAVENGLADEVGTQEDAVAKAAELAGCSTTATITLDTSSSDDLSLLLDLMSASNTQTTEELAQALKELDASGSVKQ